MSNAKPSTEFDAGKLNLSRREFLITAAASAGGALVPSLLSADDVPAAAALAPQVVEPWAPHSSAAPRTERRDGRFAIDANGTRTCTGGWQWRYDGITPGQAYEITT